MLAVLVIFDCNDNVNNHEKHDCTEVLETEAFFRHVCRRLYSLSFVARRAVLANDVLHRLLELSNLGRSKHVLCCIGFILQKLYCVKNKRSFHCHYRMRIFYAMAPISEQDGSHWMTPSNYAAACWHCLHKFENPPFGIPSAFDEFNRTELSGNFCSIACCKGYVRSNAAYNSHIQMANIDRMAQEKYGINACIPSAPDRRCLTLLGGTLSIEEFRATNEYDCKLIESPFVTQRLIIAAAKDNSETSDYNQLLMAQTQGLRTDGNTFSVRGLRRPTLPVATTDVLTTSMVTAQPSEYETFLSTKEKLDAPEHESTKLPSSTNPAKRRKKHNGTECGNISNFLN